MSPRRVLGSVVSLLVVAAGVSVPTGSAFAVGGSTPSLSVLDGAGNPPSSVAVGAPLSVTAAAPITSAGQTGQRIESTWNPAQASMSLGSLVTPEGWATQYTTDGATWTNAAPADPTTIAGVRSAGNVSSNGVVNGLQVSTASGTGTVVTGAATFQGSSGGDGWDAFDAGANILNVWHHNPGSYNLDCHEKTVGTSCGPVYSVAGYQTSGASTGSYVAGKVYSMTIENSSSTLGVLCTDVSAVPFTSCGYTPLLSGPTAYQNIGSQTLVGGKVYAPTDFGGGQLLCFDTTTNAACTSQPYPAAGLTAIGQEGGYSINVNGMVFVTANKVWCFNAADGSPCAGSWPVGSFGNSDQSVTPMRDASGTLTGVCSIYSSEQCFDLTGASVAYPASLAAQIATYPVGGLGGYSQFTFNNTRAYWFTGSWGGPDPGGLLRLDHLRGVCGVPVLHRDRRQALRPAFRLGEPELPVVQR